MAFDTSPKHGRALVVLFVLAGLAWTQRAEVPDATPPGRVRVTITDRKTGQAIAARCYLTDAAGQPWWPDGVIRYEKGAEQHFVTRGGFEASLPAGAYTLTVERGPEYRAATRQLEVRPGAAGVQNIALERWIDMNARGWYSGDLHNHRDWREMADLLLAEDLNLAATLTHWIWDDAPRSRPPLEDGGPAVRVVDPAHAYSVFDTEIERLRNGPGAVNLLALRAPVGFRGSLLSPANDAFADQARAQGGYVDAEKILWRDSAALVALGKVDFAGVVYNHFHRSGVETETEMWGMIPKAKARYRTPSACRCGLWTCTTSS